mmetsp:Transcript_38165/g.65438  ORF Transcript_38165/g.65438 Transcript_38165/m.65438 type:complete len:261 (+) Transcript_38165:20-802(+)
MQRSGAASAHRPTSRQATSTRADPQLLFVVGGEEALEARQRLLHHALHLGRRPFLAREAHEIAANAVAPPGRVGPPSYPGALRASREVARLALDVLEPCQHGVAQDLAVSAIRGVQALQALRVDLDGLAHVAEGAIAVVELRRVPQRPLVRFRRSAKSLPHRARRRHRPTARRGLDWRREGRLIQRALQLLPVDGTPRPRRRAHGSAALRDNLLAAQQRHKERRVPHGRWEGARMMSRPRSYQGASRRGQLPTAEGGSAP